MKPYLLSLAAGLVFGVIYCLIHVRSPAPPLVALVGLLGMLIGEQIPPFVKHMVNKPSTISASIEQPLKADVFGDSPQQTLPNSLPTQTQEKS
jgi:XapX domain-containing protein